MFRSIRHIILIQFTLPPSKHPNTYFSFLFLKSITDLRVNFLLNFASCMYMVNFSESDFSDVPIIFTKYILYLVLFHSLEIKTIRSITKKKKLSDFHKSNLYKIWNRFICEAFSTSLQRNLPILFFVFIVPLNLLKFPQFCSKFYNLSGFK